MTVLWAAVVFAVDGVLAVLLDRDPIESDVGPFYAVLAFLVAGLVLWMLLSGTSRRAGIRWAFGARRRYLSSGRRVLLVPAGVRRRRRRRHHAAGLLRSRWWPPAALRSLRWRQNCG
ncbi:MAG: hypothetical protein R2717_00985 [Schumannella sp.]